MTRAYIALGANLGQPVEQLREAVRRLAVVPGVTSLRLSPIYLSDPVGVTEQPRFANAVAVLDTTLEPLALLDACQSIEQALGRERLMRWGPRTIDLDLLFFGELRMSHPRLELPHPRWHERAFVLRPLLDLGAGPIIMGYSLQARLLAVGESGLEKIT
jgi:2-amino-4-hydroxy-6-hydroxymethyldihydropteridine diphosphokinase